MKKPISFLLTAAVATSLSGCGNTSDSGAEDTPKEPVIEEIVITSDNLFDYFELYEEPVMATATNLLELPPDVDPIKPEMCGLQVIRITRLSVIIRQTEV